MPDVVLELSKKTEATKRLIKSKAIFNYVTDFFTKESSINLEQCSFSSYDFNEFKNYLKNIYKEEKQFFKTRQSTVVTNYSNS